VLATSDLGLEAPFNNKKAADVLGGVYDLGGKSLYTALVGSSIWLIFSDK